MVSLSPSPFNPPNPSFSTLNHSPIYLLTMKLISKINPKHLFRSKKSRSVSRSDPSSFSSTSTDSVSTPTSVLPSNSGDLSEYSDVAEAFKMMDKDGDGKIPRAQLEEVLTRIGPDPPSRQEVNLMLTEIDADGDGCISLKEFGAIGSVFDPTAEKDELRETFAFFDADSDGKITAEELREVFAALGDEGCTLEECRRMVSEVGKSGDGFVCFEDFARMMELQR